VNDGLQSNGIQHYYTDSTTGSTVPCTLIAWHGIDPENPEFHRWEVAEYPNAFVSIGRSLLVELRSQGEIASGI
jgi:hypothetical protein